MRELGPGDPQMLGSYRTLRLLGEGGMGRVYLARSPGGRTVAVKVVRPELAGDEDFRARFAREVETARAVSGTYTAPVVDADVTAAVPWLATAYVLGPSLEDAIAAHGPLPEDSLRALGSGLAEALTEIHAAGLIHRDLKPSNVLLDVAGPRVIDFGIARAVDGDGYTRTGLVVGSPGYMSPEQAQGERVGVASDVFSLGAVLVYAATGNGPFKAPNSAAQLYKVVHEDPDTTGIPDSLLPVIRACLAKDPSQRPSPSQLAGPEGAAPLLSASGGWLPAPVASAIVSHASRVMRLEAPSGPSAVATTLTPSGASTATVPPRSSPSRRRLLTAGIAGGGLVAVGGGTAWAYAATAPKPKPKPKPPRKPGQAPLATWRKTMIPVDGAFTVHGHVLVAPLDTGSGSVALVAYDIARGRQLWTSGAHIFGYNPPWVVQGTVPAVTDTSTGYGIGCYDLISGHQRGTYQPAGGYAVNRVVAADSRLVYCSERTPSAAYPMRITGFEPLTGRVAWSTPPVPDPKGTADEMGGTVIGDVLAYRSEQPDSYRLWARSTKDGSLLWSRERHSGGVAALKPCAGNLLIVDGADAATSLTVCDPSTGKTVWTAENRHGATFSAPAVADGRVYVRQGQLLVAMDPRTGRRIWETLLASEVDEQMVLAAGNGMVYLADYIRDGVQAFDGATGRHQWTYSYPGDFTGNSGDFHLATGAGAFFIALSTNLYRLPPR
ncbi:protein kinase domain-containing protein [Mangrovactinospora gilvigrisea]|nr:serine/threonine-protein kinase [Mangrovactinospora gilvigrisea]